MFIFKKNRLRRPEGESKVYLNECMIVYCVLWTVYYVVVWYLSKMMPEQIIKNRLGNSSSSIYIDNQLRIEERFILFTFSQFDPYLWLKLRKHKHKTLKITKNFIKHTIFRNVKLQIFEKSLKQKQTKNKNTNTTQILIERKLKLFYPSSKTLISISNVGTLNLRIRV